MTQVKQVEFSEIERVGLDILEKLNKRSDSEIRDYLISIVNMPYKISGVANVNDVVDLIKTVKLVRTIENSKLVSVELTMHDKLEVDCIGITYTPEKGSKIILLNFYALHLSVQFLYSDLVASASRANELLWQR